MYVCMYVCMYTNPVFARRSTHITNKACAREKGAKKKALQKPIVCEAKHSDTINKRCAKGDKNRAKQPNRPKRNIGVQKIK